MSDKKSHESKQKHKKSDDRAELEQKAGEYLAGWQRAQADYQNLQKQVAADRESYMRVAKLTTIMQLIPLYNNFELASAHLPKELESNEWVTGIMHIKTQFESVLQDLGVERIVVAENDTFDERLHEALSQESSDTHKSGTIIREISPGYKVSGEVVVPSKVVVAT